MGNSLSKKQIEALKQAKIDRKIVLKAGDSEEDIYVIKKTF